MSLNSGVMDWNMREGGVQALLYFISLSKPYVSVLATYIHLYVNIVSIHSGLKPLSQFTIQTDGTTENIIHNRQIKKKCMAENVCCAFEISISCAYHNWKQSNLCNNFEYIAILLENGSACNGNSFSEA